MSNRNAIVDSDDETPTKAASPPLKKLKADEKGQPFSSWSEKGGFPMAHTLGEDPPYQPRSKFELVLMALGGAIRDKERWWTKMDDPEIVAQWKQEVQAARNLPVVFQSYLRNVIDDGDDKYPDPDSDDDSKLYNDPEEQDILECRGGFVSETPEDRPIDLPKGEEDEDLEEVYKECMAKFREELVDEENDCRASLEDMLFKYYKVPTHPEGHLVANPDYKEEGTEEESKEEEDEEEEAEDATESSDDGDGTPGELISVEVYKKPQKKLILAMLDYVLKECQWMAQKFDPGPSRPAAVQGVYCRADLDEELHQSLLESVKTLRSQPAIGHTEEDRHPGTPAMVDLVHPSLYCYERSRTPVLEGAGAEATQSPPFRDFLKAKTTVVGEAETKEEDERCPFKFPSKQGLQWLPSEFRVDSKTNECNINSYINNLHPETYAQTYRQISKLFVHCLPLLEDVLSDKAIMEPPVRLVAEFEDTEEEDDWGRPFKKLLPSPNGDEGVPAFEPYQHRVHRSPRVRPKKEEAEYKPVSLKDRPLQVIVKIASLELTPENNTNPIGGWHVEGCLDERIVATACCYLDTENVTGGNLEFRLAVEQPYPEQGDEFGCEAEYGIGNGDLLAQPRGSCAPKKGRTLAWANVWQHRVDAVKLEDDQKPGKRTIACFFLVDPTLRIRSTATVPPQQKAWVHSEAEQKVLKEELSDLVADKVASNLEGLGMTYEEAVERRARLMKERSRFTDKKDNSDDTDNSEEEESEEYYDDDDVFVYDRGFSLCEH